MGNYVYNKKVIMIALIIVSLLLAVFACLYFVFNSQTKATSVSTIDTTPTQSNNRIIKPRTVSNPSQEVETVYLSYTPAIINLSQEVSTTPQETTPAAQQALQEPAKQASNHNTTPSEEPQEIEIPYYIKINYGANTMTVYEKDTLGNYSVPIKAFVCSTGTATPRSGVYPLKEYRAKWVALMGGVYGQYGWQIVGDIMLHSVPYSKNGNKSSLITSYYDKLGTAASAGCIRLTVESAKWIYDNCTVGTYVEFYSDSEPGPLGKPAAQKISGSSYNLRGWDPTDPDSNNPWHNVDSSNTPAATQPSSTNHGSSSSSSHDITISIP